MGQGTTRVVDDNGADGRVRASHTGAFKDLASLEDWVQDAR